MSPSSFENLGRDLRDSVSRLLRDYSEALFLAVLMAVILRLFVFGTYKISNPTMEPSLKLGDFVIGYRLPYGIQIPFTDIRFGHPSPQRGEVVIFKCPQNPRQSCVKRVVGLPGDRIEIRKERLYINNVTAVYEAGSVQPSVALRTQVRFVSLNEKWRTHQNAILIAEKDTKSDFGPYIVPPESVFVLGDNRDFSEDSRHWGAVSAASIESRALFIWFSIEWLPQDEDGDYSSQVRWSRIFSRVHR